MCFLRWAVAVALVLGLAGSARADATPPLAMDEPKSGIHLSVEGGCQVRPADGGGAACQEYAASADKSDVFAVVLGPQGLFFYSVAIFAERELGGGVERARRVSTAMGGSVFGTPSEVTYGEQQFVRTQLRMSNGAAICFISADDRTEVAVIMFATATESLAAMEPKAEAAMRTLRRAPKPPDAPAPTAPMSCGSRALITTLLVLLFGLPMVGFIRRATKQAKKKRKRG